MKANPNLSSGLPLFQGRPDELRGSQRGEARFSSKLLEQTSDNGTLLAMPDEKLQEYMKIYDVNNNIRASKEASAPSLGRLSLYPNLNIKESNRSEDSSPTSYASDTSYEAGGDVSLAVQRLPEGVRFGASAHGLYTKHKAIKGLKRSMSQCGIAQLPDEASHIGNFLLHDHAWHVDNRCTDAICAMEHHPYALCSCFRLKDWQEAWQGTQLNMNFLVQLREVVLSTDSLLSILQRMTKREKKDVMKQLRASPYLIYLRKMPEVHLIRGYAGDIAMLQAIVRVRVGIGENANHSLVTYIKQHKKQFRAEGPISMPSLFLNLWSAVSQLTTTVRDVKTLMQRTIDSVFESVRGFLTLVTSITFGWLETLKDLLIREITKILFPFVDSAYTRHCHQRQEVGTITAILALTFVGLWGVVSAKIILGTLNMLVGAFKPEAGFANNTPNYATMCFAILGSVIALTTSDMDKVKKSSSFLVALMAGSVAASNLFTGILMLLPTAFKRAMTLKYGPQSSIDALNVEEWCLRAGTLISMSRVPDVICSDYYNTEIDNLVSRGLKLCGTLKDAAARTLFFNHFQKLMVILTVLNQKKYGDGNRKVPFTFHLASEPGVGKTLMATTLLRRVTGKLPSEIYTRPIADSAFWSGYQGQKAILYDEFLIDSPEKRLDLAKEFLQLASSSQFQPPLASVDSPAVGIKGTVARPDVVMTMNNTLYDVVNGISTTALQRRRQVVIEAKLVEGTHMKDEHTVDLKRYSQSEISSFSFVKFAMLPGENPVGYRKHWVTFEVLVECLTKMYDSHNELQTTIAEALKNGMETTIDPKTAIDEAMARSFGLPTETVDPFSYIKNVLGLSNWMSDDTQFVPEGPERRYHFCCGTRFRHNCHGSAWICHKCQTKHDCADTPVIRPGYSDASSETAVSELDNFYDSPDEVIDHSVANYVRNLAVNNWDNPSSCAPIPIEVTVVTDEWSHLRATILGTVGIIAVGWVVRRLFGKKEPLNFYAQSAGKLKIARGQRTQVAQLTRGLGYHPQGPSDIPRATLTFPDGSVRRATPIGGRWIMTYEHGFWVDGEPLHNGAKLTLNYQSKNYPIIFNEDLILTSAEHDAAFYYVNNDQLPHFRKITKKFLSADDIDGLSNVSISVDLNKPVFRPSKNVGKQSYTNGMLKRTIQNAYTYAASTTNGDCGALATIWSGPHAGKILGQHVAGTFDKGPHAMGMISPISRELVESVFEDEPGPEVGDSAFVAEGQVFEPKDYPNLIMSETVTQTELVHLPVTTKIKPSVLNGRLERQPKKQPAILSVHDPRSNGVDPIANSLADLFTVRHVTPDDLSLLQEIKITMLENYRNQLTFPAGKHLTIEEAIFGVPGILSSIDLSTGCGWPLCKAHRGRGKRPYIWFDENGQGKIDPVFRAMVEELERTILEEPEDVVRQLMMNHRFVGYMKDELLAHRKIESVSTRMIYCNDLVANVLFRKYYGGFLASLTKDHPKLPTAMGMNQYSLDMDHMHEYLTQLNPDGFIAGDYKGFDKRMNPYFQRAAYEICADLVEAPQQLASAFIIHETQSWAQIADIKFKTVSNHMSGCVLTTPVNCFVNEMMMRYVFAKIHPERKYDSCIRAKFLGDDHVLAVTNSPRFTAPAIAEQMIRLGHTYTAADKESVLTHEYDQFDQITFLGAHPRKIGDRYTGALKKDTIYEMVQWTRDNHVTFHQTLQSALDMASQWDEQFYQQFRSEIYELVDAEYTRRVDIPITYTEHQRIVANRTAGTDSLWCAEGPENITTSKAVTADGLTLVPSSTVNISSNLSLSGMKATAGESLNEMAMDLQFGLNSAVYRTSFDWAVTDTEDAVLQTWTAPTDLLTLGATNNLQNMPFSHYIYFVSDVEIILQIVGNPFVQGALVCAWVPLTTAADKSYTAKDLLMLNHAILIPNRNSTAVIQAPFRYFRNALNTFAMGQNEDKLGVFVVAVLAPLQAVQTDSITISMFSRFPGAKFTIPRPFVETDLFVQAANKQKQRQMKARSLQDPSSKFVAEGPIMDEVTKYVEALSRGVWQAETWIGGGDTNQVINKDERAYNINIVNKYTHSSVAGNIPTSLTGLGATNGGGQSGTADSSNDVKADIDASIPIPMDNPPLASGATPMYLQYPSMAKTRGLKATVKLAMDHDNLNLHHIQFYDPDETNIAKLLARPFVLATLQWTPTQPEGTQLVSPSHLNSMLGLDGLAMTADGFLARSSLAILNAFRFWRADIVVTIRALRTNFHVGRLMATMAYGAPDSAVDSTTRNQYYNTVMEFVGDTDVHEFVIPYNSATPYLYTSRGPNLNNIIQDYSLGSLMLTVNNVLHAPDTVAQTVDVLVIVRFENLRVYEANPVNYFQTENRSGKFDLTAYGPVVSNDFLPAAAPSVFKAEGPVMESLDPVTEVPEQDGNTQVVQTQDKLTSDETKIVSNVPYHDDPFGKFPSPTRDLLEVMRRYTPINPRWFTLGWGFNMSTASPPVPAVQFLSIPITPLNPIVNYYGAWAGSLHYRIYTGSPQISKVAAFLHPESIDLRPTSTWMNMAGDPGLSSMGSGEIVRWNQGDGYWKVLTRRALTNGMVPLEIYPPDNSGKFAYIDVSVPFNTIFQCLPTPWISQDNGIENYYGVDYGPSGTPTMGAMLELATSMSRETHIAPNLGFLTIAVAPGESEELNFSVNQAVGDDFRLFGFRTAKTYFSPLAPAEMPTGTLPPGLMANGTTVRPTVGATPNKYNHNKLASA